MNVFDSVKGIANAVLYEGYLLFPYTASSRKNQIRWQFGVLMPQGYADLSEATAMETQLLVCADACARIDILVRFFQVVDRPIEREIPLHADVIESEQTFPFAIDTLRGSIVFGVERDGKFFRITLRIRNEGHVSPRADRNEALRSALVGAQALLHIDGGKFISLLDPANEALAAAARCSNRRIFPVLVGTPEEGGNASSMALASAIILYDFPSIAPHSDGNKFDGTEIDELLNLTLLSLTDEEKAQARSLDPAARAMLDRVESLTPEQFSRMHGTMTHFERGARVRLHPKRRADAWDFFLEGRTARVQAVQVDFEDNEYVTVTVDDDPASDLHEWYGRSLFFYPDEIEPLDITQPAEIRS